MSSPLPSKKTPKLFLSQFSIAPKGRAKAAPILSKDILHTHRCSNLKSKTKLSCSTTFQPSKQNKPLQQKRYMSSVKREGSHRLIAESALVPLINSKLHYLKQKEFLDIVLAPEQPVHPMQTDLNESSSHLNRNECYRRAKSKRDNELTSDHTIEQDDSSKLLKANVSRTKQKSLLKRMSTIEDDALFKERPLPSIKQSSLTDRLVIKLINPEDCIEEYVDHMKPGDTYKRFKLQLLKQKDKIVNIRLDMQKTQNAYSDLLKRYVSRLRMQSSAL